MRGSNQRAMPERATSYESTSSTAGGSSTGFEGLSTGEPGSGKTGSCGFMVVMFPGRKAAHTKTVAPLSPAAGRCLGAARQPERKER